MQGEDGFYIYAHLAYQNHNILPNDYMQLPLQVRKFMAASDSIALESLRGAKSP